MKTIKQYIHFIMNFSLIKKIQSSEQYPCGIALYLCSIFQFLLHVDAAESFCPFGLLRREGNFFNFLASLLTTFCDGSSIFEDLR